jgi:predicted solute-binding protein
MSDFSNTHVEYNVGRDTYEYINALRHSYGDTDLFEPYKYRTWFTMPFGCIYIRKDLDAPSFLTFLLLKKKHESDC